MNIAGVLPLDMSNVDEGKIVRSDGVRTFKFYVEVRYDERQGALAFRIVREEQVLGETLVYLDVQED